METEKIAGRISRIKSKIATKGIRSNMTTVASGGMNPLGTPARLHQRSAKTKGTCALATCPRTLPDSQPLASARPRAVDQVP